MGFYIDLELFAPLEFRERRVPLVLWVLWGVLGFALSMMGLSAGTLLNDLLRTGNAWDFSIVVFAGLSVLGFLVLGIKLLGVRKFIRWDDEKVVWGQNLFGLPIIQKRLWLSEVEEVRLSNERPSPNIAPHEHKDKQYYLQGHWRVVLKGKRGRSFILDRQTDEGALRPLYFALSKWISNRK